MTVVAVATGLFGFSTTVRAQQDEPQPIVSRAVSATVDYGNDAVFQPGKHGTDFDRLGVRTQQILTITVQFPPELAGQTILVDPLDGGAVTVPEEGLLVGSDGNVTFQFQTSEGFGAARIAVHQPDDNNFVQFWVVDPEHPENTPPDLLGVF
ncbi:MAG: hypothetical protein H0V54_14720 [Chthoniobacterales bacterium]|nr:hypothetical protein [Chthoniobacterales bacterium]